jgi:hypothetical protein
VLRSSVEYVHVVRLVVGGKSRQMIDKIKQRSRPIPFESRRYPAYLASSMLRSAKSTEAKSTGILTRNPKLQDCIGFTVSRSPAAVWKILPRLRWTKTLSPFLDHPRTAYDLQDGLGQTVHGFFGRSTWAYIILSLKDSETNSNSLDRALEQRDATNIGK